MRRSKGMNHPLFRPITNGQYKIFVPKFIAHEGEDGDDDKDEGDEAPFTHEQMSKMSKVIHKAIGTRLNSQSFKDNIGAIAGEAAAAAVGAATEGLTAKMEELLSANPGGNGNGRDKDESKAQSWKDSPEYKAMIQRDKDRDAEIERMKQEREDEKNAADRKEERATLEAALRKAGIEELKLRSCVATLIHEDKVMQRDSNGQMVYRVNRGEYNEDMTVSEGVSEFITTDEGKAFLPAKGATGTGAVGDSTSEGTKNSRKGASQTKEEAAGVVTAWLSGAG